MKIRKKEQNIIKTMPQNQQNSLRKNEKKLKSVKLYQEKKKGKVKSSKMTRSENKRKEQETTGTQRWELLIATISNAHTFVHRESSKTQRK